MRFGMIDFDDAILQAVRNNRLVIFVGAGVSMGAPAGLPSFKNLTQQIAQETHQEITKPYDQFLGDLQRDGVKLKTIAQNILNVPDSEPNSLHFDLLRLFRSCNNVRIVTTNFDLLFEMAAERLWGQVPAVYSAPALPPGHDFSGIIHIHGTIKDSDNIVLTDADFGCAYLAEGWTRRFLVDLFYSYSVLFIGYSHDDIVMQYLSRGLPSERVHGRFALTEAFSDKWDALGIKPIRFSEKNDFKELYVGIKQLADCFDRSMRGWRTRIEEISAGVPPTEEAEICEIEQILQDVSTTRLFTKKINSLSWLKWMDEYKYLDALFLSDELTPSQRVLSFWVADIYFEEYPEDICKMIIEHGSNLNYIFWCSICQALDQSDKPIDNDILHKTILILLKNMPEMTDDYLLELLMRCEKQKENDLALHIFLFMSEYSIEYRTSIFPELYDFELELQFRASQWVLAEAWERLKPHIEYIQRILLSTLVQRLENIHSLVKGKDISYLRRFAIEQNQQNIQPQTEDVVIDVIRDTLEWMVHNAPEQADSWIEIMVTSSAPMLRRIAVHTMGIRLEKSSDERLQWLLNRVDLFTQSLHHEVFHFIAGCYPAANEERRRALVDAILAQNLPELAGKSGELRTDSLHFRWLSWLNQAKPDCSIAKDALLPLRAKYPSSSRDEHPDFLTYYAEADWLKSQSPLTVEELLSMNPQDHLDEWDNFTEHQTASFTVIDRKGLFSAITDACKLDTLWSISLAETLAKKELWNSDIWYSIIESWKKIETDKRFSILPIIKMLDLQKTQTANLLELMTSFVNDTDVIMPQDFLTELNDVAESIWQTIDKFDQEEKSDDWLMQAINHPKGRLAMFLLKSLSTFKKINQGKSLPEYYRVFFTRIINNSDLGRSVILSNVAFLFALDRTWTRNNLLPYFKETDKNRFQQAWDGFLSWGELYKSIAKALIPAFIYACSKMNLFNRDIRTRFVQRFAILIVNYVEEPYLEIVPAFYKHASAQDRSDFLNMIGRLLNNMDKDSRKRQWEKWLHQYYTKRSLYIFKQPISGEIESMLEWLVYLDDLYPVATSIVIQFPVVQLQHCNLLFKIKNCDLVERYPYETAKLMIYLCKCMRNSYHLRYLADVITRLHELPLELIDALNEELIIIGLPEISYILPHKLKEPAAGE